MNAKNLYKSFSLYLEGLKIPSFNTISISQEAGVMPAAMIVLAATAETLRLLGGTIVHVFATLKENNEVEKEILLFEGEIVQISYSAGTGNSTVTLKAQGILSALGKAKLRPAHAIITNQKAEADMIRKVNFSVNNDVSNLFNQNAIIANKNNKIDNITKIAHTTGDELRSIAEFGTIAVELGQALNEKSSLASKGEFNAFLKQMFKFFLKADVYFGINAVAYKLMPSIFAFPNPDKVKGFDLRVGWEAINSVSKEMNQDPIGDSPIHLLLNLVNQFTQYLSYSMLNALPYPAVKLPHTATGSTLFSPLRMYLLPQLDATTPPKCNVFFPETVSTVSYSRDLLSEPTRVVGNISYSFVDEKTAKITNPIVTAPVLNLKQYLANGKKRITSNFTDEESYRGIVLKASTYDGTTVQAMYNKEKVETVGDSKDKTTTIPAFDPSKVKDQIEASAHDFVVQDYIQMKYGQRVVGLTGEWSPYYLVGLSAMYFKKGHPTIVGVLQASTLNITAQGQAQATYTISNVRLIFDEDTDTAFQVNNSQNDLGNHLEDYVLSDFNNGGMLCLNKSQVNENYYGPEKIGKEIYPLLVNGEVSTKSKLFGTDGWFYKTMDKLIHSNISNTQAQEDCSIYSHLTNEDLKYIDSLRANNYPSEVFNTLLFYRMIRSFKKDVSNFSYDQIIKYGRRHLLTKKDYYYYIQGNANIPLLDDDAIKEPTKLWQTHSKNLAGILQNQYVNLDNIGNTIEVLNNRLYEENLAAPMYDLKVTITPEEIKALIKEIDAKIKELQKTKDNEDLIKKLSDNRKELQKILEQGQKLELPDVSKLCSPYNTTRMAHVNEIIKKYKMLINSNIHILKE